MADRESELERVANHFELDYQPYGGTLIEAEDGPGAEQSAPETWWSGCRGTVPRVLIFSERDE